MTEAHQFVYLCNEMVYEAKWLGSIDTEYTDDCCTVRLVGVKPGVHALVVWTVGSGFTVKISRPDSYYSDSGSRAGTAEEAFSLVSLLGCD